MEMKFDGEFEVDLPREKVFVILSDPEKFAPLIPTFHSLEMKDERTAMLRVKVGIGKIRGTASTELTLTEAEAPYRAVYIGKGKVMQGVYESISSFELEESGQGTLVKWQAETNLVGKILSLAGGGMRGYAEKEISKLISSLQNGLSSNPQTVTAKPKADGWLARILRKSDSGETETAETPVSESKIAEGLAGFNDEQLDRRKEAQGKIDNVLSTARAEKRLPRKEDNRLIRGQGLFVDDFHPAGMLHMVLVRSPYAHAKILNIDVSAAEALPGVVCTLTGAEVKAQTNPFTQLGPEPSALIQDYCLAIDKALYQGDPVVAVVAESVQIATDAAQLVDVEYETLPVVVDCKESMQADVMLHEQVGSNYTWQGEFEFGEVDKAFEDAKHVVKIDHLKFHRYGSTALEPNAVVATWNQMGELDYFSNTIMAVPIAMIGPALSVSSDKIRLRTHDIGGAFGNKIGNYPHMTLAALASKKAGGAPVKWLETRSEHMQAGGHGSERNFFDTEVALDADGVITAIRSTHVDDCGAYPRYEPLACVIWAQVMPATYKLRNMKIDMRQVVTNKGPCAPNRGYSRLPHLWFMERCIDICGHELGIPADEIRLRNYIQEFPYTTPNGCVYDSGDLPMMLKKAKALVGWDEWKKKQEEARKEGRYIGIGIGTTLDSGTNNFGQSQIINPFLPFTGQSQASTAKLDLDGTVSIAVGSFPQGQGHETTSAQVAAEVLGIDTDFINVKTGFDTARNSHTGTGGTYASQFAVTGLSAVHGAAVKLRDEMKKLAAFSLEANEDDLEFGVGEMGPEVRVKGSPDKNINFWALSNLANYNTASVPEELRDLHLNVRHVYVAPFQTVDKEKKYGNLTLTYAMQLHIAVIELNRETAQTKILDYGIIDDCGTVINHMIVEGQSHGGAGHGIAASLLETMPHDKDGNVICGSFTDYAPITINNMPDLKYENMESPSPFSYNGAKGMGEGGGAPLLSISAAMQDALYGDGIIIQNSHHSPMFLYEVLKNYEGNPVSLESR
ncbi:MAG: molybdopterin-dependent oxidoreductase [Gammaproteobacteria bacterium]|jgi:CO/xanthine dehydrogenase Mo-binding subunit/carbon monoxide dehydrogenase subunit G|nr:molybdopterin-dependent oxidoreductase [Gammaproteobacteria bacterium]